MAIVGGAIVPLAQSLLADSLSLRASFVVPVLCYAFIVLFGWTFRRLQTMTSSVQ
jgi:FHS family L-fucose permease-like MFS transporter